MIVTSGPVSDKETVRSGKLNVYFPKKFHNNSLIFIDLQASVCLAVKSSDFGHQNVSQLGSFILCIFLQNNCRINLREGI